MTSLTIGICGAGIGGLAAASLLCRAGHEVVVFDQFDAPKPVGSGLVIQPVGLDVLDRIGLRERTIERGAKITNMVGHEAASGRRVLAVDYRKSGRDQFGLAIHRAELFQVLFDAAKENGVRIETNKRATAVSDAPRRKVTFDDGTQSAPFDLVIDACGAGSALSPLGGRWLGFGALWTVIDMPDPAPIPTDHLMQRYRGANRMLGLMPLADGKAAMFWSIRVQDVDTWRAQPIEHWKSEAKALWPALAPCIDQITSHDDLSPARYRHGTLKTPYADGIAYIGDAAHRASPQLGQGANMALLDAAALADALADHPINDALAQYAKTRRTHIRIYQTMSALFTPQYQSDSRWLPWLRDWVLMPLSTIPPVPYILSKLVCGHIIRPLKPRKDIS